MTDRRPSSRAPLRPYRTPLPRALRRLLRLAWLAERPGAPPVDELLARQRAGAITRRAWLRAAATAAAAAAGPLAARAAARPRSNGNSPRIVIVGAGLAGLNAANVLRKMGLESTVYHADGRLGGRIRSATGLLTPGAVVELGGEFIDSDNAEMIGLCGELGLDLVDLAADPLPTAYFLRGRHYNDAELIQAFRPLALRIAADRRRAGDPINFAQHTPYAARLDRMSLREYLRRIGAVGAIRDLLDVAYVGEYGLDSDRQSSLNFISQVGIGPAGRGTFDLLGDADERFKVRGGNSRVVDELAARLPWWTIFGGYRLASLRARGGGFLVTFDTAAGPTRESYADFVLLALPFTSLREVDLKVPMPPVKRAAIAGLAYGTNAKVVAGVDGRPWRDLGFSGDAFTDEDYQGAWDSTQLQGGAGGGLSLLLGGVAGLLAGAGTAEAQAGRLLPGVERTFPGTLARLNGKFDRAHWPSDPFVRGSYACYTPGQWTTIAGAEILPLGNLYFAGEHCSAEFQGLMNGAAETGRVAAEAIAARVFG